MTASTICPSPGIDSIDRNASTDRPTSPNARGAVVFRRMSTLRIWVRRDDERPAADAGLDRAETIAEAMFPKPTNATGRSISAFGQDSGPEHAARHTGRRAYDGDRAKLRHTRSDMTTFYKLDFEAPVDLLSPGSTSWNARWRRRIGTKAPAPGMQLAPPEELREQLDEARRERHEELEKLYANLSPWNTVRVARHPDRPQTTDYIGRVCRDFVELHGDRRFGDDPAIVTGFGRIGQHKCLVVGHRKGKDTNEKIACHFGCAPPRGVPQGAGEDEAGREVRHADRDAGRHAGRLPGDRRRAARARGEAIAVNLREMSRLRTPIVSVVIGEGGSGGALGIAVADRVGMLRYAWYSVISPEGCAAILWKQANEQTNSAAAEALQLTAEKNLELGIVDSIVDEPLGGAHREPDQAANLLESWISAELDKLTRVGIDELLDARYERYRRLGVYLEQPPVAPEPDADDPDP